MLLQLKPQVAVLYFNSFIITMRREWSSIDHHRLDKFLMIFRRFVAGMLAMLKSKQWYVTYSAVQHSYKPCIPSGCKSTHILTLMGVRCWQCMELVLPQSTVPVPFQFPAADSTCCTHRQLQVVKPYATFIQNHILLPSDTLRATGVAYHMSDLFVHELKAVAGDDPVPADALHALLSPFCATLARAGEQATINRVK